MEGMVKGLRNGMRPVKLDGLSGLWPFFKEMKLRSGVRSQHVASCKGIRKQLVGAADVSIARFWLFQCESDFLFGQLPEQFGFRLGFFEMNRVVIRLNLIQDSGDFMWRGKSNQGQLNGDLGYEAHSAEESLQPSIQAQNLGEPNQPQRAGKLDRLTLQQALREGIVNGYCIL